jgi:hypothetical protein
MFSLARRSDKNMHQKWIIAICSFALLLCSICALALAQSPAGVVAYAVTTAPIAVPAGSSLSAIAPVSTVVPTNAYQTLSVVYRVILFATAPYTSSTATVGLDGTTETSAAVNVPAGTTVPVLLETTLQTSAGANLQGSVTVTAGSGGSLTVEPSTSVTLEALPTFTAESEDVYKSRW